MFINSKKHYQFVMPGDPQKVVDIPAGYLGPVDDWVTKQPLFQLAVKEASITTVGHEKTVPTASGVSKEEKKLRAQAVELGIKNAAELSLMELVVGINNVKNPPSDAKASKEEQALRKKAKTLNIEGADKLSLVALALAVNEIENPQQGVTNPGVSEEKNNEQQIPPEN